MIFIPSLLIKMNFQERIRYMHSWYLCLPGWKERTMDSLTYFSVWSLISMLFLRWKNIPIEYTLIILWNTWLCSLTGAYITLFYPRYLYVPYLRMFLDKGILSVMDLLSHQFPFLYTWHHYRHQILDIPPSRLLSFWKWIYLEFMIYCLFISLYDHGLLISFVDIMNSINRRYHLRVTDICFLFVYAQYAFFVWYLMPF